ncbi:hypothetical protein BaRGS_00035039, partial [Batillaria attramentaria]
TCAICSGLDCLLSDPSNKQCPKGKEFCTTSVHDTTHGRDITRGCGTKQDCDDIKIMAKCRSIENKILNGDACVYCCSEHNCNAPPSLIPQILQGREGSQALSFDRSPEFHIVEPAFDKDLFTCERCASTDVCVSDWWLGTSTNPACSEADVTSGHVTSGMNCTFCCHEPSFHSSDLYCNDSPYPDATNIVQFPNVPRNIVHYPTAPAHMVSRCSVCDDHTPGKECSSNNTHDSDNCMGQTPYCARRIIESNGILKVWKGCASMDTCLKDWWLGTSTNPACSEAAVTSGHVTSGMDCTFCCHEPSFHSSDLYCNDRLYPDAANIVQFPDVPVNDHDNHTRSNDHSASHDDLTCHYSTISTSSHSNTSNDNCNDSNNHPRIVTILTSFLTVSYCPVCVTDSTTGQSCDVTQGVDLCGLAGPYCMTSFYRQAGGYRIEKRCATKSECSVLWLTHTQKRRECMAHDLKTGTGSDLECHYCCHNSPSGNLCNADQNSLIPKFLMQVTQSSNTATTTSKTTTAAASVVTLRPSTITPVCFEDPDSRQFCMGSDVSPCKDYEPYCLNILTATGNGANRVVTLEKTCATESVCRSEWWDKTRLSGECMSNSPEPPQGQTEIICSYCCQNTGNANITTTSSASSSGMTSSAAMMTSAAVLTATPSSPKVTSDTTVTSDSKVTVTPSPSATITTSVSSPTATMTSFPSASMLTSTADPSVSTPSTSTTTVAPVQTSVSAVQCAVCDRLCPLKQHEETCPDGFCMTSVTDDDSFNRVIVKSCVSEDECYKQWWQGTANQNLCLSILSMPNTPTGTSVQCHYCCYGDRCNSPDFPDQTTLYNG